MFKTAKTRKEEAVDAIKSMLARGETIAEMKFGDNGGKLYVSSQKGVLNAFDVIEHDNALYYFGLKK